MRVPGVGGTVYVAQFAPEISVQFAVAGQMVPPVVVTSATCY